MAIQINGNGTITGISVGGLPDGIVDTDMIAANAVTSAKSSGLGGLSMHDSWYISSGWSLQTGGTQLLTSNWTRDTRTESGSIGSAMTQSSGVFTFPSTGIYKISVRGGIYGQGSDSKYYSWTIQQTSNNSSYSTLEAGYNDFTGQGANTYSMFTVDGTFDVTDTSLCKVRFAYSTEAAVVTSQDIGGRHLHVTFTKLGDT